MKVFSNIIDVEAVFLSFFFLGACILLLFLPMFELLFEGFPRGIRTVKILEAGAALLKF